MSILQRCQFFVFPILPHNKEKANVFLKGGKLLQDKLKTKDMHHLCAFVAT